MLSRLIAPFLEMLRPVGDFNTAGGDEPDDDAPAWDGGRWRGARWAPIHPGRQGGAIRPWAVVVHTTDMHPSTFGSLVRAWQRSAGRGAGAHFLIGRTPAEGVVQMVDVGRNGNHAGGAPAHGWFKVDGKLVHPNRVTTGIEVHAGGAVRKVNGQWRCMSDGAPVGAPLPAADVVPDARRPERGWHVPNAYQLEQLQLLLDALVECPVMAPYPHGFSIAPNGIAPAWAPDVAWRGKLPVVGHVTLDPNRKSDPGPVLSGWLESQAALTG